MKLKTTSAAAIAAVMMAGGAHAATVNAVNDSFTVSYNYQNTLLADLTWTVTGISGTTWSFDVLIDNKSPNPDNNETNRITSFGFTTDPSATSVNASGGWTGTTTAPITAGYQNFNIEACVFNGTSCVGGGGGTTVGVAGDDDETVQLSFNYSGGSPLTFTSFATRWQSMSVNAPDGSDSMVLGPTVVPLPAAGWLMLAGLGGLAALRRRKTA